MNSHLPDEVDELMPIRSQPILFAGRVELPVLLLPLLARRIHPCISDTERVDSEGVTYSFLPITKLIVWSAENL